MSKDRDIIKQMRELLAEVEGDRPGADLPRDLCAEEVQAYLAAIDQRLAAGEGVAETEGQGRPRGPEIFVDRMTAEEVVARLHELEEQEKAERWPPRYCADCGKETPRHRYGGPCEFCQRILLAAGAVKHWTEHLQVNLVPLTRERVEGELREAKAKLRQARADRAAYSRREQEDEGKDEGGGLLAGLRDNNDGRMGR